ncbi:MAG: HAMP domain-containing histidine kinase [Synechococcales cyanobacterium M58_A2018_015]|nr:HAMP domain-containing histidine kinase [Synechococcales cyanobacterium M58_A2018_015]
MIMPVSSEFVALCRAQVALLTQGLGAALSIVYLTEELTATAEPKLIPIVAHPESAAQWEEEQILSFLTRSNRSPSSYQLPASQEPESIPNTESDTDAERALTPAARVLPFDGSPPSLERSLLPQQQIVLPLIHQDVVMGLLVTARTDRPWNGVEQEQIQQVAQTLTLGCLLDRRVRWLSHDLQQQQLLEEHRQDALDTLLHQFRNPLTALRTFGKLLVKRLKPGDANRTVAEGIIRESDRLQELLIQLDAATNLETSVLLDAPVPSSTATVARSSSSEATPPLLPGGNLLLQGHLQLQPHALIEVLNPLLESAAAIAQDRQLELHITIPADLPPVLTDGRALREVITNLIDNALKYTPSGGRIDVRVVQDQATPSRQGIVIADTGPGIPPQDLEHLFERHYRGVQAMTEIPGTGLGLSIAHSLVQQMQGEIQVFSPAQTSGLLPVMSVGDHPGTAVVVWLPEQPEDEASELVPGGQR